MRLHPLLFLLFLFSTPARAEFIISSAIIEFQPNGPRQQDIEIISRSETDEYIVAEVSEIIHPGLSGEERRPLDDPTKAGLLVTPSKTVLGPGARKVLRFVLMREPDASEHIYRVAVKPIIKGVDTSGQMGLKILIGYEVLVIVRPDEPRTAYEAVRTGDVLKIRNTGNTSVLFQGGRQCGEEEKCKLPPVVRVYPNETNELKLPYDKKVSYSVWDGKENVGREF